jgi:ribonuclease T2
MNRLTSGHPLKIGLCLLLVAVCASSVFARHRRSASDTPPGEFAYYLLSLSWSPAFCLSSPGAAECSGPRRFGFIVHGLWPQNEQGWPENCDVHEPVPDSVVNAVSDLMPARGLVYHEWSAHGTCSGLIPAEFFATVRRAYASIAIPAAFSKSTQPVEQTPGGIAQAFLQANPRLPAASLVVTCSGQGSPRLREIHICLDRELNARACSADAARGACRATSLIVPPIR